MVEGGLDAGAVLAHGADKLHEGLEPRAAGPSERALKLHATGLRVGGVEDCPQGLLEEVGAVERAVGLGQGGKALVFVECPPSKAAQAIVQR